MREFDTNPASYEAYAGDRLYEGERVYRFAFASDEAFAIREDGEDFDEFFGEVSHQIRLRHGRGAFVRHLQDVTHTFGPWGGES